TEPVTVSHVALLRKANRRPLRRTGAVPQCSWSHSRRSSRSRAFPADCRARVGVRRGNRPRTAARDTRRDGGLLPCQTSVGEADRSCPRSSRRQQTGRLGVRCSISAPCLRGKQETTSASRWFARLFQSAAFYPSARPWADLTRATDKDLAGVCEQFQFR